VPGAINIGAGQNLSLWAGWLIDPNHRIVLITETGDDEESRRALVRVGLDRIEGYLQTGFAAWISAGMEFTYLPLLSVHRVAASEDATVLDVRGDAEWASGHIEGAQHLMLGDLPHRLSTLPDEPIIAVCGSGYRSSIAASLILKSGRQTVSSMDGGMSAWKARSLALQHS
jgi:hydroxyacylglutathione hydrolase